MLIGARLMDGRSLANNRQCTTWSSFVDAALVIDSRRTARLSGRSPPVRLSMLARQFPLSQLNLCPSSAFCDAVGATLMSRLRHCGSTNDDICIQCNIICIRFDTIEQFNVDSKAECVQLNLAHVARKNIKRRN